MTTSSHAAGVPRPGRRRPVVIDVGLAALTFAATLAMMHSGRFHDDPRGLDALGVVLAALTALPLLWRRRWPLVVFPVVWIPTVLIYSLGYSLGPPVGSMIALYEVAASPRLTRTQALRIALAVAAGLLLFLFFAVVVGGWNPLAEVAFGVVTWGASWYVGDRVRLRRERREAGRERAERERRLAAAEERTRIARDLHDSAGHAINVILVQAGAARLLHDKDPAGAREALETIEEVARETLGEIDRLVRALRDDQGGGRRAWSRPPGSPRSDDARRAPPRRAASTWRSSVRGERAARCAPALDQAAYRILQESLTNAARHGAARRGVEVGYGDDALELDRDQPRRARPPGARRRRPRDRRACASAPRCSAATLEAGATAASSASTRASPTRRTARDRRVRVLIVDDDDLMRAGLRAVLSSDATIEVVGEAGDGARGRRARPGGCGPDVVLMDVRMPDLDGIAATREVLAAAPEARS